MTYNEAQSMYAGLVNQYNEAVNYARQYGMNYAPIVSWTIEPWGDGWDIIFTLQGSSNTVRAGYADFVESWLANVGGVGAGLEESYGSPEQAAAEYAVLGVTQPPLPVYEEAPEYIPPAVPDTTLETQAPPPASEVDLETPPPGLVSLSPVPTAATVGDSLVKFLPWVIGLFALRGLLK